MLRFLNHVSIKIDSFVSCFLNNFLKIVFFLLETTPFCTLVQIHQQTRSPLRAAWVLPVGRWRSVGEGSRLIHESSLTSDTRCEDRRFEKNTNNDNYVPASANTPKSCIVCRTASA